jgi:SAM-dependent methyltransferase
VSGEARGALAFGEVYDEDYFEHGVEKAISGYSDYRWLPEATIPLAHELVTQLGIRKSDLVLDFGCAKGFLVKALRLLRYDAWGYDTSTYAVSRAPDDVRGYILSDLEIAPHFDWVISKDVLEHVPHAELPQLLKRLCEMTGRAFVVVPLGAKGKYVIADYELDVTHVIREDLWWWCRAFEAAGFYIERATTDMKNIKPNWEKFEGGNGFFILRREVRPIR